jgi:hypothetical protein
LWLVALLILSRLELLLEEGLDGVGVGERFLVVEGARWLDTFKVSDNLLLVINNAFKVLEERN